VLHVPEADISIGIVEGLTDGILSVGRLGAVHGSACEKGSQFRDPYPEELIFEDVVHPFLAIGDLSFQPSVEAFGDLPKEHARLAAWVEERGLLVAPEARRKHVKHAVRKWRRGEDLVTAQVSDTGEYVGVVAIAQHGRSP
jgi:hypothetical protein